METEVVAGFQLAQLVAACENLVHRAKNQDAQQQQQQDQQDHAEPAADNNTAPDALDYEECIDDDIDLYGDLQQQLDTGRHMLCFAFAVPASAGAPPPFCRALTDPNNTPPPSLTRRHGRCWRWCDSHKQHRHPAAA